MKMIGHDHVGYNLVLMASQYFKPVINQIVSFGSFK